ncbi:hypothetical protein ACQKWADRAFT_210035 [Trichoderma austrokoningii]
MLSRDDESPATFEDVQRGEDDIIGSIPDDESTESGDETTIVTDESDDNKDAPSIKGSYDITKIAWKDNNGLRKHMKEIEDTKLNICMNVSVNTAMFMVSTYITLKGSRRKSNKQQLYLLMPPERIKTITKASPTGHSTASDATTPNNYALHFSLTQGPDCIGPQGRHISSKRGTQEQLALMQDLATVTELTFHLTSSDIVARGRQDFERLATTFSAKNKNNRPCKDKK